MNISLFDVDQTFCLPSDQVEGFKHDKLWREMFFCFVLSLCKVSFYYYKLYFRRVLLNMNPSQ